MIPDIQAVVFPKRLITYLFGPGHKKEHTDQHVVAGSEIIELLYLNGRNLPPKAINNLTSLLQENDHLYTGNVTQLARHCSLTLPTADGVLSDEKWRKIAQSFMDKMEFHDWTGAVRPRHWVAVRHGLTANGHDGIHLVYSLIDDHGKKADLVWKKNNRGRISDYEKAQLVAREIEKEYGLTELDSAKYNLEVSRGYDQKELIDYVTNKVKALWNYKQIKEETNQYWSTLSGTRQHEIIQANANDYIPRFYIRHLLLQCKSATTSESDFIKLARFKGLILRPRYKKGGNDEVSGYSVAIKPEFGQNKPRYYSGSSVDKELNLSTLRKSWEPMDEDEIIKTWKDKKQYHTRFGKTPTMLSPDELLTQMENEIVKFRSTITDELIISNPLARNTALHQMSNLYYLWSLSYEGNYPSDLARMGQQLRKLEKAGSYKEHNYFQKTRFFQPENVLEFLDHASYKQRSTVLHTLVVITKIILSATKNHQRKINAQQNLNRVINRKINTMERMIDQQTTINEQRQNTKQLLTTITKDAQNEFNLENEIDDELTDNNSPSPKL
jgi:hypothetical protein